MPNFDYMMDQRWSPWEHVRYIAFMKERIMSLIVKWLNVDRKPLLSAKTCEQLGLLTVHVSQTVHSVRETDIMTEYADVFTGLGCLPGEYHMEIDDTVKPVQHQPRRVAVALKPELQKKIDELERKGVLAKVTTPTDWISSMVAVRKPSDKLRICLDPQDLNRALK